MALKKKNKQTHPLSDVGTWLACVLFFLFFYKVFFFLSHWLTPLLPSLSKMTSFPSEMGNVFRQDGSLMSVFLTRWSQLGNFPTPKPPNTPTPPSEIHELSSQKKPLVFALYVFLCLDNPCRSRHSWRISFEFLSLMWPLAKASQRYCSVYTGKTADVWKNDWGKSHTFASTAARQGVFQFQCVVRQCCYAVLENVTRLLQLYVATPSHPRLLTPTAPSLPLHVVKQIWWSNRWSFIWVTGETEAWRLEKIIFCISFKSKL